jgi:hypothetical protein
MDYPRKRSVSLSSWSRPPGTSLALGVRGWEGPDQSSLPLFRRRRLGKPALEGHLNDHPTPTSGL